MLRYFSFVALVFIGFSACQDYTYQGKGQDVPTQGTLKVGFESGDTFLVKQWLELFEKDYPNAHIIPVFTNYSTLVDLIKKDSLSAFIVHKQIPQEQFNWLLENKNVTDRTVKLGYTSTVFITNPQSSISELTYEPLLKWLSGDKSEYSGKFQSLVADFKGNDILQINDTLNQRLHKSLKVPNRVDLTDPQKIIQFVHDNPGSLGVVSLNTIGDTKDRLSIENAHKVKILKVQSEKFGGYYYPYQSQIAVGQYPFIQPVMAYDLQGYSGLMSGFVVFINSQIGQFVLKHSGLYSANPPARTIEFGTD